MLHEGDDVSKGLNIAGIEDTFGGLETEVHTVQAFENASQVAVVGFLVLSIDYDVINVDDGP